MKLNQNQKDLLIGTLLGDGNLQTATLGRTWRYRALHSGQQEEYLHHKYEVLKDLCNSPPKASEIYDKRIKKTYYRYYFNTLVTDTLRHYGNLFYTYDKKLGKMVKDVPMNVEKILTARAIAYWYMDDGSVKHRGVQSGMRFCTESFSEEGVNRLKNVFKNKYNIDATLVRKTNSKGEFVGKRLYVGSKNAPLLCALIKPYIIDCMLYKLPDCESEFTK